MIWEIYWLTRLVAFGQFLGVIVVFSAFGFIGACAWAVGAFVNDNYEEEEVLKYPKRLAKYTFITGLTALSISVFVPSKNDLLLMFSGQAAFQISNNEQVSGIVKDALGLLQDEITKARQDNEPKKETPQ